jgi:RimJ/RimL family protein N-acetyltransferase
MEVTAVPRYPDELETELPTEWGTLRVRPMRPDDGPALVAFHEALSPDSQYMRFFTAHPHLAPAEVDRFTHVDYDRRLALVAELAGTLVGVGRYDRIGDTPDAEVAFVVADSYQCHGLGGALLHRLAAAAADRGIGRFVAETLPGNQRMLRVFRDSGFDVASRFEDGVVRVAFPIIGSGAQEP